MLKLAWTESGKMFTMQSITCRFKQCLDLKTTTLSSWVLLKIPNYILNNGKEKVRESNVPRKYVWAQWPFILKSQLKPNSLNKEHLSWLSNKKSGKEGEKAGNLYYRDDVMFASHCEKAHKIRNSSFIHNRMLLRNFMSSKKHQIPYHKHIQ